MTKQFNHGHRTRLRTQFIKRDPIALTDAALLELILTYSIPQKDVKPIAEALIDTFGSLDGVLSSDTETLSTVRGIKDNSAVLMKLVDYLRQKPHLNREPASSQRKDGIDVVQETLFPTQSKTPLSETPRKDAKASQHPKRKTDLFGKSLLKDSISLLPQLPDTETLDDARKSIRSNLHSSAQETRRRHSDYIIYRMFPSGRADYALRHFAKMYAGRQELREVAFYRFCTVETLMYTVIESLIIPYLGAGEIDRSIVHEFLTERYPTSKSVKDCVQAVVEALVAGGIALREKRKLLFSYREISLASFAFILHSEFPLPGMYDIAKVESSRAMKSMLWKPDRLVASIYELRNKGILSKVSEIDGMRQFTTKLTLDEFVRQVSDSKDRL